MKVIIVWFIVMIKRQNLLCNTEKIQEKHLYQTKIFFKQILKYKLQILGSQNK